MADGRTLKGMAGGASASQNTGHQRYFLHVPDAPYAKDLSIVSWEIRERLGEPHRVELTLTSPATLERRDYLNKPAEFTIELPGSSGPDDAIRKFGGYIQAFGQTKRTPDYVVYRLVIEPTVARLRLIKATRVYQKQSAPEIIEAILRRHDFEAHQFSFKLRHDYPRRAFRMQYQTSDWDYIRLLMEQTGLFCFFRTGKFGDEIHFGDDVDAYTYRPEVTIAYREHSGLSTDEVAVLSLASHSETIPESIKVADYNPAQAHARFHAEANVVPDEPTTWGQSYAFGTHHLDDQEAHREARLRHEAARARQVTYRGRSTVPEFAPGLVVRLDEVQPDATHGLLIVAVTHSGARDASYINTFEAIPCDRPYRLALDEDRWPSVAGTLSARITSRDTSYPYADMTAAGCYPVRFDFDFDDWANGEESVPLRLAKPFAGGGQTGFHFPLLAGTEVSIAFASGDPNRPYIAHTHHNSDALDPITSRDQFNTRNVIRTQGNKLRLEDEKGHESAKLATAHARTQLNMGYLVGRGRKARGEGFEVRTDGHGAVRAAKGLFLTADAQTDIDARALDMQVAGKQLQAAKARMKSLAEAAAKAKATLAACESQQALLETQIQDLQAAVLLATAPHGVAITSGEHMQLAAGGHLFTSTGGNADAAIGGNFTVAAGRTVSLFASTDGMKLYAAEGAVDVQAQGDSLNLAAKKGVSIVSTSDAITLNAKESLTLMCGGAYIKLSGHGVEIGSPHDVAIKGPLRVTASATLKEALPLMPQQEPAGMQLFHTYANGTPVKNAPYRVTFPDGAWRTGMLDAAGKATLANVPRGGGAVTYDEELADADRTANRFEDPEGSAGVMSQDTGDADPGWPSLDGRATAS